MAATRSLLGEPHPTLDPAISTAVPWKPAASTRWQRLALEILWVDKVLGGSGIIDAMVREFQRSPDGTPTAQGDTRRGIAGACEANMGSTIRAARLLTRADLAYLTPKRILIYADGLEFHSALRQRIHDTRQSNQLQTEG